MFELHRWHAALRVLRVHRADVRAELRAPVHLLIRPRGQPRHCLRVRASSSWSRVRPLHARVLPRDRHRRRGEPALPAHDHLVPRLRTRLPDWRLVQLADRSYVGLHMQVVGVHMALERADRRLHDGHLLARAVPGCLVPAEGKRFPLAAEGICGARDRCHRGELRERHPGRRRLRVRAPQPGVRH